MGVVALLWRGGQRSPYLVQNCLLVGQARPQSMCRTGAARSAGPVDVCMALRV